MTSNAYLMNDPHVDFEPDIYRITLNNIFVFNRNDFLIQRTDDHDDQDVDENGYSYSILANGTVLHLTPHEAESIVQQIFDFTGSYVCDY